MVFEVRKVVTRTGSRGDLSGAGHMGVSLCGDSSSCSLWGCAELSQKVFHLMLTLFLQSHTASLANNNETDDHSPACKSKTGFRS